MARNTKKANAIGLAVQIVFEYDDWGWEHISDMLSTYEDGDAPCSADELYDLCQKANMLKTAGRTYQEVTTELLKGLKK